MGCGGGEMVQRARIGLVGWRMPEGRGKGVSSVGDRIWWRRVTGGRGEGSSYNTMTLREFEIKGIQF